jgi:hypothetical protein
MTQVPEAISDVSKAIGPGQPSTVLIVALAILAFGFGGLVVSMLKRRDAGTLKLQSSQNDAFQNYLDRTATATERIAESSATQTLLLTQINSSSNDSAAQMKAWGSRDWLQEGISEIKDGVQAVHADVRVLNERLKP